MTISTKVMELDSIDITPTGWQVFGDLAIDQLKIGNVVFVTEIIEMMTEKLVALENVAKSGGGHIKAWPSK